MDKTKPKLIPLTDSPRQKSVKSIPLPSLHTNLDDIQNENYLENDQKIVQKLETDKIN
jgi:hypothetical protein